MSEANLDQIVKGAPPPNVSTSQVAAVAAGKAHAPNPERAAQIHESKKPGAHADDPASHLPSSPPQIYLNLLILEASLRSQYLALRARRRRYTFFLTLLALWNSYFCYALFFRPREDGKGVGGSPYWVVDMGEKMAFMGGILTAVLVWGTGQWERGVRWPRRWVGITNRGLRGMNLKIVVLRGPWWRQLLSQLSIIFPYKSFFTSQGASYHVIDYSDKRGGPPTPNGATYAYRDGYRNNNSRTEDIARGGDYIKLLLLPKHFSPEFRENWELYRAEYWEKENERRAELRKLVKARERDFAKEKGGWLWWTGWKGWEGGGMAGAHASDGKGNDLEKVPFLHHHHHQLPRPSSKDPKRRRPSTLSRDSHSRSSSRSSTPAVPDADELRIGSGAASMGRASRRARTSIVAEEAALPAPPKPLTRRTHAEAADDEEPILHKRASTLSNASFSSNESEQSEKSTTSSTSYPKRTRQRDLVMSDGSDD